MTRAILRCSLLVLILSLIAGGAQAQVPSFILEWGSLGTAPGQFRSPFGIAVDPGGYVYVCDQYNCRVQKFGPDGTFILSWGSCGTGPGQFYGPHSIGVDAMGDVAVLDESDKVHVFTSDGAFIRSWVQPDRLQPTAADLTLDAAGTVYIADEHAKRIEEYTLAGDSVRSVGSHIITSAGSVAVDPYGNIYAGVDYGPVYEIVKFDPSGNVLARWGQIGSGDGQFNSPVGIAANGSVVYVADHSNSRVQMFTSDGTFLGKWGTAGTGNGEFQEPARVAVAPDGSVYVVDVVNNRVQKFGDILTPTVRRTWGALKALYR